jgi:phage repressor protein C with HTH and peptisase S24 domain
MSYPTLSIIAVSPGKATLPYGAAMPDEPSDSPATAAAPAFLAARIRERRTALGLTQADLGKKLGVTRNAVSQWESGTNAPASKLMIKLASALRVPLQALLERPRAELSPAAESGFGPPLPEDVTGEVRRADVALPTAADMPRDVPVYGTAAGSVVGAFQFDGIVDYVRRPPALAGVGVAYALYITGTSMEPEHNPGDLRFIHPGRPPRVGDTVIVQTKNHEADGITAYIKTLVRMNEAKVVLHQRNPVATIELDRRTVVAVHRVLTLNELFGV